MNESEDEGESMFNRREKVIEDLHNQN